MNRTSEPGQFMSRVRLVCGTVRTVVWEDGGETRLLPD
jgi:hypothetical protein